MSDYFESGFFVKDAAWHRKGTVKEFAPTSIEQAMEWGNLDWQVIENPVFVGEEKTEFPEYKALVRDSDNRMLSIVGKGYQPLQNVDAFRFFNPFLHEKDAQLDAGGSLMGGKRIWVLAKIGDWQEVAKDDAVCPYLLLYNSHDGSTAVGVQFTSIRVVCSNTLSAAMSSADNKKENRVKVRHTKNMKDSLKVVQNAINLAKRTFEISMEEYRAMVARKLDVIGLEHYIRKTFNADVPNDKGELPKVRNFELLEHYFQASPGNDNPAVAGSVWAAYNGITHWIDAERGNSRTNEDSRLNSSWFGEGRNIRDRAHKEALALIS